MISVRAVRSAAVIVAALSLTLASCSSTPPADEVQHPTAAQTEESLATASSPAQPPSAAGETSTSVAETNPQQSLQKAVDLAVATFGGTAGIAVSDGAAVISAGDDTAYPAWSTSKVPIAIAALRHDPSLTAPAAAAITASNNEAAETLWLSLPEGAADEVLAEGGAQVSMNTEKIRPEFSVFGQTAWSPSSQATFAASLPCIEGAETVLELMGQVSSDQVYGIGQLPGARFKGGWGPDTAGGYQVRQFGRFTGANGDVAVALTAIPSSGQYGDAQAMASMMATQLADKDLPAATCG